MPALRVSTGTKLSPECPVRPLKFQKELSDEWAARSIKKQAAPGGMTTIPIRIGIQFAATLCLYQEKE